MSGRKGKKQPEKGTLTLDGMFAGNKDAMAGNTNKEVPDAEVTNAELKDLLLSMDRRINARMDAIEAQVKNTLERVTNNEKKIGDLAESVEHNANRIQQLDKGSIHQMTARINFLELNLRNEMTLREIHDRKQNLLFYGAKKEREEDVYQVVRDFLVSDFNFTEPEANNVFIVNAHRLPSSRRPDQQDGEQKRPDPIIVRFGCMYDRDCILEAARTRGFITDRKPIVCYTDLPARMKRLRGQLATQAKVLRAEGKYTRIRVDGTKVILEFRDKQAKNSPWNLYTP
jgi:hypothetical protein